VRPTPTFVSPVDPRARGRITVLARTTVDRSTVVPAVVTTLTDGRAVLSVPTLARSRIVLVRRVYETVRTVRDAPPPISPQLMLRRSNVISSDRVVRTTDLDDHRLDTTVPAGLRARDYVVAVQDFTERCRPTDTAEPDELIGLVRVVRR
jgi:hypothetical protein